MRLCKLMQVTADKQTVAMQMNCRQLVACSWQYLYP